MRKLTALGTMLILLFLFSNSHETSAQIQDIKKKSKSNKSRSSSRSSSKSSSKKKSKSYSSNSSYSNSGSDVDAADVFGCITNIFDVAGCLFSAFENNSSSSDYSSNDYDYEYNYNEPETHFDDEIVESEEEVPSEKENNATTTQIETKDNKEHIAKTNIIQNSSNTAINYEKESFVNKDSLNDEGEVSLDIRAHFDLSMHKGKDKNYLHVDYLPGLRAHFDFLIFDFRFNILTEYTDDFPDSFKSWELLAMFNLTPKQDYNIFLGTGMHKEEYNGGSTFHEYYLGTKLPLKNKRDFVDIDTRFSTDYKTNTFPFFEFGGRYNVRFLETKNLSGYITLGATYQNYYQSYDIWGIRGGVLLNVH